VVAAALSGMETKGSDIMTSDKQYSPTICRAKGHQQISLPSAYRGMWKLQMDIGSCWLRHRA
jgi:hypothetical protein